MADKTWSRRTFIERSALGVSLSSAGLLLPRGEAAAASVRAGAPVAAWGLQIGEVFEDRALVWSRADRPAKMIVEYAFDERFRRPRRLEGPLVLEVSDFTGRVALNGLP